jgi:aryl-alcohol dehydrogenase-like predicted oxidoreductase
MGRMMHHPWMKYTTLGRSGLMVSRICLGCMSYGSPAWHPWVLSEEEAMPFFRRAVETGINFFDTANVYSLGESERILGKAIRTFGRRDEAVVATKVFFPTSRLANARGLSRKHIVQACEASLERLGLETIDLYQFHRFDPSTPIEESLAAMDQLVRQGKVHYIGAGSTYAWRLAQALSASERNGWARFVSLQNLYNLVYREEEREMLPLCAEAGLGVVPWSPLASGLLAGTRTSLEDRASTARARSESVTAIYDQPGDWEVVQATVTAAKARGTAPAEVALAWLLSKPVVTAPIVGATKLEHLDAAIRALDVELDASEIAALEAPYRPHAVRGWL